MVDHLRPARARQPVRYCNRMVLKPSARQRAARGSSPAAAHQQSSPSPIVACNSSEAAQWGILPPFVRGATVFVPLQAAVEHGVHDHEIAPLLARRVWNRHTPLLVLGIADNIECIRCRWSPKIGPRHDHWIHVFETFDDSASLTDTGTHLGNIGRYQPLIPIDNTLKLTR